MIFGKIKGYNIVCFSKKKAEKGNFGTAIHSVIQEKELQEEILAALASGGQVYALYKEKEMMACYIWVKDLVNVAEYAEFEEKGEELTSIEEKMQGTGEKQQRMALVLKKEYMVAAAEEAREQFEKVILEEVKESMVYQDIKHIAWKDTLLVQEKIKIGNLEIAGGIGFGIALGMMFGIVLDNIGIGILLGLTFGYMFATTFRTLYRNKKKCHNN